MRKFTKVSLIAAGALCAAGLLVSTIGFAMVGTSAGNYSLAPRLEQKNYQVSSNGIHTIELASESIPIVVIPSPDDNIHISYKENKEQPCEITNDNGTLQFEQQYSPNWYDSLVYGIFSSFRYIGDEITLRIPVGKIDNVAIFSANSCVSVSGISLVGNLSITTSNGDVDVTQVDVSNYSIHTSNASIRSIDSQIHGSAECYTSNGAIHLKNMECNTLWAETSNRSIECQRLTVHGTLQAISSNGKISMERAFAGGEATLNTSNAAIQLEEFSSPVIALETRNGKIEGTILGSRSEYSVIGRTSNGNNSLGEYWLPEHSKQLTATTSNADIALSFTEE